MADHLVRHAENYNLPLQGFEERQDTGGDAGPPVILDPQQQKEMVLKLLEREKSVLTHLWKSLEERDGPNAARTQKETVDFSPR